jgi:hypothetical protein
VADTHIKQVLHSSVSTTATSLMVLLDMPTNLVYHLLQSKTTLAILGLIIAGVYITKTAIAYSRLSHIPGPPFTGISDIPHGIANFGPAHQEWYAYCNEKYGKLEPHHSSCRETAC